MVLSYYFLKYPYSLIFGILSVFKLNNYYAAYIGDELDYCILEPVLQYLPKLKLISKNKRIQNYLVDKGHKSKLLPAFPKGVLMCRLAAHKFPAKSIKKISLTRGAYHFKALPNKKSYLLFDKYIFTGKKEAVIARSKGITNIIGINYPKLDKAFNGQLTPEKLEKLKNIIGLDSSRLTLLFTATWDKSGMSAIKIWYDKLENLTKKFNLLISLHSWVSEEYKTVIRNAKGVFLISDYDTTPYVKISDICIGDTSSILGDCCALDKPIITFKVNNAKRTIPEIRQLIDSFSIFIDKFDELLPAIKKYIDNPYLKKEERDKANSIMFSNLDGSSGAKIAESVKEMFYSK